MYESDFYMKVEDLIRKESNSRLEGLESANQLKVHQTKRTCINGTTFSNWAKLIE